MVKDVSRMGRILKLLTVALDQCKGAFESNDFGTIFLITNYYGKFD